MDSPGLDSDYLQSLTILYVEDDADVREQFARYLHHRCGTLICAEDGAAGLEAFRAHRPRIVVTDILMPVLDGLSMAREIHELDRKVLIIVTTAFERTDYLLRSIEIGVDRYVTKPVNADLMSTALLDCAHRLRIEEQLARETECRRQAELALLEAEIRQRGKELREHVEAEERARVSRDIHDGVGQSLMALKLNLEMLRPLCAARQCRHAETVGELAAELSGVAEELKDIFVTLRPAFLEATRLDEALVWLGDRFKSRSGLEVRLVTSGITSELGGALKLACFRVCQEALNNVTRHAEVASVSVSLICSGRQLRLVIRDLGRGGVPDRAPEAGTRTGCGLSIMRERARLVGGSLGIDSPPGLGTTITLEAPLS